MNLGWFVYFGSLDVLLLSWALFRSMCPVLPLLCSSSHRVEERRGEASKERGRKGFVLLLGIDRINSLLVILLLCPFVLLLQSCPVLFVKEQ
jgi:hypothetical protein